MVYFDMLVVVGFCAGRLAAYVAGERPHARMDRQMLSQVITPVECFTTIRHFAYVFLFVFVLLHVPLAVVLPDELASAVIARVRSDGFVSVHV